MDDATSITLPIDARRRSIAWLTALMLFTDVAFVVYWTIVYFGLLPDAYLFSDYKNPTVSDWNYSFVPLDLLISLTGFVALGLRRRGARTWRSVCFVSLTLTFCSGLQAVAFWAVRREFDPAWWAVNVFLMAYPLLFLRALFEEAPD
jgi:Family of unknown function (DUF5360)